MDRWIPSSKRNPCPICGRVKDTDCRVRADGQMAFCHRGKSQGPPERLRVGDTLTDGEGRIWAYTGDSRDDSRDGAVFVIHQERADHGLPSCAMFTPATTAPAVHKQAECNSTVYQYAQHLRVLRYDFDAGKKKEFQPQFFFNERWNAGAGSEIWPFYGSLDSGLGQTIIEVEGEKCVDVLREAGIAAITHPGHQRNEVACRARYAGLLAAGVKNCLFCLGQRRTRQKESCGFHGSSKSGAD